MTVGGQDMQWDMIRVKLDQNNTSNAFGNYTTFRKAVIQKSLEQVDAKDYDSNGDGLIDTAFIIVSDSAKKYKYTRGGSAKVDYAYTFVDSQGSGSVKNNSIVAFNHEASHALGLPDLYGKYNTLSYLTLMGDPGKGIKPGSGFCAYGRMRLKLIEPTKITKNTKQVKLKVAEENLDAVMIPGLTSAEFFLIEYRKRPSSGYLSSIKHDYNGLAIYHVWTAQLGAGQNKLNPPLIRMETPKKHKPGYHEPTVNDFWFLKNPKMLQPYTAYSFYAPKKRLFQIKNIKYLQKAMQFDVKLYSVKRKSSLNMIINGDFEKDPSNPENWVTEKYKNPIFKYEDGTGINKSKCVSIELSDIPGTGYWYQDVKNLTIGKTYEFSGWIKTKNIQFNGKASVGANLSIISLRIRSEPGGDTKDFGGSHDWKKFSISFKPKKETVRIACRLGYWSNNILGKAWFDNIEIREMDW